MKKLRKELMTLTRLKSKPGSAVQRFGDWRKGEPQVIIDNQTWLEFGKPDKVTFDVPNKGLLVNK
jgi:hypothetical protein